MIDAPQDVALDFHLNSEAYGILVRYLTALKIAQDTLCHRYSDPASTNKYSDPALPPYRRQMKVGGPATSRVKVVEYGKMRYTPGP